MYLALNSLDKRITPYLQGRARCPHCRAEVIARCGDTNNWHWAHKALDTACPMQRADSEWALLWKSFFPQAWCEQILDGFVFDVVGPSWAMLLIDDTVSQRMVSEARAKHPRILWIVNGWGLYNDRFQLKKKLGPSTFTFRWKHARRSLYLCDNNVFLDLSVGTLFEFKKLYLGPPCSGWGNIYRPKEFVTDAGGIFNVVKYSQQYATKVFAKTREIA